MYAKATEIIQSYLPPETASQAIPKARLSWALWAVSFAEQMVVKGDVTSALIQMREAFLCSRSLLVIKSLIWLVLQLFHRLCVQALQFVLLSKHPTRNCQDAH